MNIQTKFILLTIFCTFQYISCAEDKCEACGKQSEAYCVDKSSYYYCMNGIPLKSTLLKCEDDKVCTNSANICEDESEDYKPLCDSSCNKCPTAGSPYTCVSKTEYGRCINGDVVLVQACESGTICNVDMLTKGGKICAPKCVLDFFGLSSTCTNDEQITTTVPPPPTPDAGELKKQCQEHNAYNDKDIKIYYIANDDECKTYIYCEKIGNSVEALFMRCSTGFFDLKQKKCVEDKKEQCGKDTNVETDH